MAIRTLCSFGHDPKWFGQQYISIIPMAKPVLRAEIACDTPEYLVILITFRWTTKPGRIVPFVVSHGGQMRGARHNNCVIWLTIAFKR